MRADVADHVFAGRVDYVYPEEMHYTAEFFIFCVFKSNVQDFKLPKVINITVAKPRPTSPMGSPLCAESHPQLNVSESYIVLLTGDIESGVLYPMTVNAQKSEFNLTQDNIDDMQEAFGMGKMTQGINTSGLKECPNELDKMMMTGSEEEDDDVDTESPGRLTPSDLRERTDEPEPEIEYQTTAKTSEDEEFADGRGHGCLHIGSPFLLFVTILTILSVNVLG